MDKELEETSKDHETASKSCCKGGCTATKVIVSVCAIGIVGGIVWLVLSCPSCH